MLGYGDLTILTASGAEGSDTFTTIKRAGEFRTALQSTADRSGGCPAARCRPWHPSSSDH
jgi:hypothetical protein